MMKTLLLTLTLLPSMLGAAAGGSGSTQPFMSDKTEISVDLDVSGAEALCQTDDGYIWIAQYSGLTRYDSREYVAYKSFEENGKEYSIINVKALASKGNTLYIATSENVFVYSEYKFSHIDIEPGVVKDIALDEKNDLLYVSYADKGGTIYDINTKTYEKIPGTENSNVNDIALDVARNTYYYQTDKGVYDKDGNEIYQYERIYELYSFGDILYIGQDDGVILRYNMAEKSFLSQIDVKKQVNRILHSPTEDMLYVACDTGGLHCVDLSFDEPVVSVANGLKNNSQLVDLMFDYEGNLWIASHYSGASSVSIIAKNALVQLLYGDAIWEDETLPDTARNIYAIERYGDILYIVSGLRIYPYDLTQGAILSDNPLMEAIEQYCTDNGVSENITIRDVEIFNGKLYFAVQGIGLIEFDPSSEATVFYNQAYIASHLKKTVNDPDIAAVTSMRALRAYDGYLGIAYARGVMRFDGADFSVMFTGRTSVLYLSKTNDGKMVYCVSQGIFVVDDDFSQTTEIPTDVDASGNRLKFLIDGDSIYFTLNSRLFRLKEVDGKYVSSEVVVPHVKGSLVELSKIEYVDKAGQIKHKYVIASQTQIFITDSLDVDQIVDFEFYDSTNGLPTISPNTSGYYDPESQKYYFQSAQGVFVYDFNENMDDVTPVKVAVSSVELDGESFYGNTINIAKDVYRITIDISVLGFRPSKGHQVYYKMDGVDNDYHMISGEERNINYTNLPGGEYTFRAYAIDEYGQKSNQIEIRLIKEMKIYETAWFWVLIGLLALSVVVGGAFFIIRLKTSQALKKQLEYKNITVESIQAIARTIDAKDEYTNGHSTRVGYYSKLIAENLGMSQDEIDNIYYIALLHDIGKIAIPDKILNKPGKLTDEEFAVMKSHTTRGAKILQGISTIPHIVEGAKSHHEKYDGTGYPDGLKGEDIPFVARIICCADCFDAMASKRVYKPSFSLDTIVSEFKRCAGTQFDPKIAKVVVEMIESGKLKPIQVDNTYLGEDGKTHRITANKDPEKE